MSRVIVTLLALLVVLTAPVGRAAAAANGWGGSLPHAPVILVFGDSLSVSYGVPVAHGWVSLLAQKLARQGYDYQIVNASVSGETTEGGLARLPRALALHAPRIVILELGANDGLRGLPVATARENLDRMINAARGIGASVLLIGTHLPPNYGERYTTAFYGMYGDLARSRSVALVPFLMAGVALNPELMQADGLHPNQRAQPQLLANVWPELQPLLRHTQPAGPARRVMRPEPRP